MIDHSAGAPLLGFTGQAQVKVQSANPASGRRFPFAARP